nr:hypothetical protein [Arthrobacter ulcerisalmonis]
MDEKTKDKIEDGAAAVVEAGVSIIPFVGGPAAVLVNRAFGSATQRRNEKLFDELSARIENIVQQMDAGEAEKLLEGEDFQAAAHRVFRASQETASAEKRRLLQNALMNGYLRPECPADRDEFLSEMVRYEPEHVVVLQAMEAIMASRSETLPHAVSEIRDRVEGAIPDDVLRKCVNELVADDLLGRYENSEVEERSFLTGGSIRRRETKQVVRSEVRHSITAKGKNFLLYVAEPSAI